MNSKHILNKLFTGLILFAVGTTSVVACSSFAGAELEWKSSESGCELSDLELSGDFAVYGVNAKYPTQRLPYPIDDSGVEAGQIDVIVNSPQKPVILLLKHGDPAVWKIQRTEDTQIAGAVVYGYHELGIIGLTEDTPTLINTLSKCGLDKYFYGIERERSPNTIERDRSTTQEILAEKLFGLSLDGLISDRKKIGGSNIFYLIGENIEADTDLISSQDTSVESFYIPDAPRVGYLGLTDAVEAGKLRPCF